MMISRELSPLLFRMAAGFPAITLTGPRQSGKTTLCKTLFPRHSYVNLEELDKRAFARQDPRAFLAQFTEGAIIDEIQHAPNLLSYLQVLIDENREPGRWILTGSQNLALLRSVSQSLAGRTSVQHLLPLTRGEITGFDRHPTSLEETLFVGSYPGLFDRRLKSQDWFSSYVATYIERDVRTLTNIENLSMFHRFVQLCAGRTGELVNYSSLAGDCGISQPTAKAWLSVLEASFIVFLLPAFKKNIRKRLIKMSKLYFYDTGLVCWLLGINHFDQLRSHPLQGSIFETWVISEIVKIRANFGLSRGLSYYREGNGAEIDLVVERPNRFTLLEAKSAKTASPRLFHGSRRVRRHFDKASLPCSIMVAYGGEQTQERKGGRLIPWCALRRAGLPETDAVIFVFADGRPAVNVNVLVQAAGQPSTVATTNNNGEAILDLRSHYLPLTVYVATDGFKAHVEREWIPAERTLHIELHEIPEGGAIIFSSATGHVPGMKGRLNPIRDSSHRTCIYADNVSINYGEQQPVPFAFGKDLHMKDTDGKERRIRIIDLERQAALVEYRSLRSRRLSNREALVLANSLGQPIANANVLALFPNKTWKRATTDDSGQAKLELHSTYLPMTVFVAVDGFAAHVDREWMPAERTLQIELRKVPDGGAVIFPLATGQVPGLTGRLNPIRDRNDKTYIYADNISINDGEQQPVPFVFGEDLRMTDADGNEKGVRIIDVIGRAAIVEYSSLT